eukprot:3882848-Amphidinium_carterae.1
MPATPPLNNYDMQQEAWMSENDGLEHHDSESHELEPYEVAAFEALGWGTQLSLKRDRQND